MTIHSKKEKGASPMALDRHISALLDILRMEIRSFNAVIELLIIEERCLVKCDTSRLAEVIERLADLTTSIACLEKSRMETLERIALETGENADELTISRISGLTGEPLRKELQETAEILSRVYDDMRHKKITNSMLIRQGILMAENDIRVILKACGRGDDESAAYTISAGRDNSYGCVYLDGRI
jgi:hypothetical protein